MNDAIQARQAVRASQDRLATLVDELDEADLVRPSYDDGWTVADVLSHLGSQAEIFLLFVDAGLSGTEAPTSEAFGPIWDTWNSKAPVDQVADSIAVNEAFVRRLEALDDEQLGTFSLSLFGMDLDAAGLLRMRLSEHAIHSWDVAVAFDEGATIPLDAAEILVDALGATVERVGQPTEVPLHVAVATSAPALSLVLETEGVRLTPGDASGTGSRIEIAAEALIRLVYGRLDDDHLGHPAVVTQGIELDVLRQVFPGV